MGLLGYDKGAFLFIVLLFYTFAEALIGAQYLHYASQLSKPLLENAHMRAAQPGLASSRAFSKIWGLLWIFFMNGMLVVVMVIAKVLMLVEVAKGIPSPLLFYILLCANGFTRTWSSYWVVVALAPTPNASPTPSSGRRRESLSLRLARCILLQWAERGRMFPSSRMLPDEPYSTSSGVSELPPTMRTPQDRLNDLHELPISESSSRSSHDYTTEWPTIAEAPGGSKLVFSRRDDEFNGEVSLTI